MSGPVLSPRERECLRQVRSGRTAEQVADAMGISVHTVNSYLRDTYRKLGAHNRMQAVMMAATLGEI